MIDVPRQTLSKIIAKHGVSLCADARRCEALLRDLCPAYRREINILTGALEERVAVELLALRNGQGAMPREMLLARLVRRLEDHLALTGAAAQWAVDSWALALGVVSEAEVEAREKKAEKDRLPAVSLPPSNDATNNAQATNATTVKSTPPPSLPSKPSSPPPPPPQSKSSTPAARQPTLAPASTRPKSGVQIFAPAPIVKSSPPHPVVQPRAGKRVFPPSLITPIIDPSRRKRRGGVRGCLLGCVIIIALLVSMFFVVPAVITYLRQEQERSRENNPPRVPSGAQ